MTVAQITSNIKLRMSITQRKKEKENNTHSTGTLIFNEKKNS